MFLFKKYLIVFLLLLRIVLNFHMIYLLGGTVVAALKLLRERGVDDKQIKVVSK